MPNLTVLYNDTTNVPLSKKVTEYRYSKTLGFTFACHNLVSVKEQAPMLQIHHFSFQFVFHNINQSKLITKTLKTKFEGVNKAVNLQQLE